MRTASRRSVSKKAIRYRTWRRTADSGRSLRTASSGRVLKMGSTYRTLRTASSCRVSLDLSSFLAPLSSDFWILLKSRSPTLGMCPWPMKIAREKGETREMELVYLIMIGWFVVLGALTWSGIVLGRCLGSGVLGGGALCGGPRTVGIYPLLTMILKGYG